MLWDRHRAGGEGWSGAEPFEDTCGQWVRHRFECPERRDSEIPCWAAGDPAKQDHAFVVGDQQYGLYHLR